VMQQEVRANTDTPANIYEQATAYQLGALGTTYKPVLSSALAVLGMMAGVLVVDAVLFYLNLILLTGYDLGILLIISIIVIIYGIHAFNDVNLRVYQFANGLIRAKGAKLDVIRWDQVVSIVQNVQLIGYYGGLIGMMARNSASTNTVVVQRNDGATFKFGSTLRHVIQLIQTIQGAVTQAHMPKAMAAYNAGSPVVFGMFILSQQGLNNWRGTIPWNEVQSVDIKNGHVIIKQVGKTFNWANARIATVPNALVFMSMINYARTGKTY